MVDSGLVEQIQKVLKKEQRNENMLKYQQLE